MKILYKQSTDEQCGELFYRFGLRHCYLKEIPEVDDERFVTKKEHSHTGYEIHIIAEGGQTYSIGKEHYTVRCSEILIIPPNVRHRIMSSLDGTFKYSLVFSAKSDTDRYFSLRGGEARKISGAEEIVALCRRIAEEKKLQRRVFSLISEAMVFELAVAIFRLAGFDESRHACEESDGNAVFDLAKKYINDNVEQNPSVTDVAAYCYLGEKQLTRIFERYAGVSPGCYIRRARACRIETLLVDTNLSIKEISRIMNFDNEYYFNAFFKKNYGMPPGEYRKS